MRIGATCDRCGREFLLFQLYNASPALADRCPHCFAHLGIIRVSPLAVTADRALAALVGALEEIAGRKPAFRLDPESVLTPVREALGAFSEPPAAEPVPAAPAA